MSTQESRMMTQSSWPPYPCYAGHRPLDKHTACAASLASVLREFLRLEDV